jgi:hypothetical protein
MNWRWTQSGSNLSQQQIPGNREINREFRQIQPFAAI